MVNNKLTKSKVFFRYKPIEHFIESLDYNIEWRNSLYDPVMCNNLEVFDISESGVDNLNQDYLYTEIKYDILIASGNLQQGVIQNKEIGQEIIELNGETFFNKIPKDAIQEIYTIEENPEYFL